MASPFFSNSNPCEVALERSLVGNAISSSPLRREKKNEERRSSRSISKKKRKHFALYEEDQSVRTRRFRRACYDMLERGSVKMVGSMGKLTESEMHEVTNLDEGELRKIAKVMTDDEWDMYDEERAQLLEEEDGEHFGEDFDDFDSSEFSKLDQKKHEVDLDEKGANHTVPKIEPPADFVSALFGD